MIAILITGSRCEDNSSFGFEVVLKEGTIFERIEMRVNIRLERRIIAIKTFELSTIVVLSLSIDYISVVGLARASVKILEEKI